jgi:uncharacterized damage-inducible protein DinB
MPISSEPSDVTAVAPAPEALPVAAVDPRICPACKKSHTIADSAALKGLAQSPAKLAKLVKGLDATGWKRSYGPGKWSIRQILAHLRDCEMVYAVRWRKMISEEDAKQALATWSALRVTNLEMLKLAGKSALSRSGHHPEYGTISGAQLVRHILAHDENHLGQIEQARASGRRAAAKSAAKSPAKAAAKPKRR